MPIVKAKEMGSDHSLLVRSWYERRFDGRKFIFSRRNDEVLRWIDSTMKICFVDSFTFLSYHYV